jgi:hypothetical protein
MRLVLTDAATPRTVCATSASAIPRFPPKDRFMKTEAYIAVRVICQRPQIHRHEMEQTVKEPAAGAARLMGETGRWRGSADGGNRPLARFG